MFAYFVPYFTCCPQLLSYDQLTYLWFVRDVCAFSILAGNYMQFAKVAPNHMHIVLPKYVGIK